MFVFNDIRDWCALAWFLACWIGYTYYTKKRAKNTESLSAVLFRYRVDWMRDLMRREQRISDMALIGNLKQMVNFMASTTILVLAGSLTLLSSSDRIVALLSGHRFIQVPTQEQVQFKLFGLVLIFVYVFFRFTWAMRQHTFCSILIGAAPLVREGRAMTPEEGDFATQLARISDRGGHEFNYGLRAYYFALSYLAWFISPVALVIACTLVTVVLYRREFYSRTLEFLSKSRHSYETISARQASGEGVSAPH